MPTVPPHTRHPFLPPRTRARGSPPRFLFLLMRVLLFILLLFLLFVGVHLKAIRERHLPRDAVLIHITQVFVLESICETHISRQRQRVSAPRAMTRESEKTAQKFHCTRRSISSMAAINARRVMFIPPEGTYISHKKRRHRLET